MEPLEDKKLKKVQAYHGITLILSALFETGAARF
jgi:hypothetical protein